MAENTQSFNPAAASNRPEGGMWSGLLYARQTSGLRSNIHNKVLPTKANISQGWYYHRMQQQDLAALDAAIRKESQRAPMTKMTDMLRSTLKGSPNRMKELVRDRAALTMKLVPKGRFKSRPSRPLGVRTRQEGQFAI